MNYDPERHHRRSIRLKGYDYTQPGAYFITIVTQNRECVFGEIADGVMRLNEYGGIVGEEWFKTADLRPYVELNHDEFVVMPNHIHGIIWIAEHDGAHVGAQRHCAPTGIRVPADVRIPTDAKPAIPAVNVMPGSIGAIVRAFKSATTKRINEMRGLPGAPVWQRNYYEHIIRGERALERIRQYIAENPIRWHLDRENPNATGQDAEWDSWTGSHTTVGARCNVPQHEGPVTKEGCP